MVTYKHEIAESCSSVDNGRIIKKLWIDEVTTICLEMDIKLKHHKSYNNWHVVEKLLLSKTTGSSQLPIPPVTESESVSSTSEQTSFGVPSSSSALGVKLVEAKKAEVLAIYEDMDNRLKWKLKSGRYVEDVMKLLVVELNYVHPVCDVVLDIDDDNWKAYFSAEDLYEIREHLDIEHETFPSCMQEFLDAIPKTNNISEIFRFILDKRVEPETNPELYWLVSSLEAVAYMFISKYIPITDQTERDLIRRVWCFIDTAFDFSELKFRSEKQCQGSKIMKNKKRKISAVERMDRQIHGQIPDMVISFGNYEFGMAEVAKEAANTKEINEGRIKCCEIMNAMLANIVETYPSLQHEMKIVGFLISGMKITLLELSNPFGFVKLLKREKPLHFPEHSMAFITRLFPLLKLIWVTKLDMEARLKQVLLAT